jgi:uncharacterized Zn finger protein (UPF0148 family)
MRDHCPRCGGPMHRHRIRPVGALITYRRDCQNCDHRDKVIEQPAKIISVLPVVRRRTSAPTNQPVTPLQFQHEDQNHDQ